MPRYLPPDKFPPAKHRRYLFIFRYYKTNQAARNRLTSFPKNKSTSRRPKKTLPQIRSSEVPPPSKETRIEGPFGECPGYYAHGATAEPVIRVKALYFRSDPILAGAPPLKPLDSPFGVSISAAAIWNYLDKADVPDIRGVWCHVGDDAPGGGTPFIVVSLKQRYQGHAQQAGIAALGCRAGNYHGRFLIVVDEDIDPADLGEVIWAISTRCDPKSAITIVDGCWSTLLDPVIPPERKEAGDLVNSRAILNACRPYAWKERFPPVNTLSPELRKKDEAKWRSVLG